MAAENKECTHSNAIIMFNYKYCTFLFCITSDLACALANSNKETVSFVLQK